MVSRKRSQADEELSIWFYQYCCRVIGKKKVVKTKRQICNAIDHVVNLDKKFLTRIGGSTAEGLGLKSSDYDMSLIINTGTLYHIYEHNADINTKRELIPLALQTDDTKPGYTKMILIDKSREKECSDYLESLGEETLFSSEKFRKHGLVPNFIVHGPCHSDPHGNFEFASCLKCDEWISCAQPWINRSRTLWPPINLVESLVNDGVQFAPIGCKGSPTKNIEWRISFAVAEKQLICSLSHYQILCYGLLKILLKDVKELGHMERLCSYFIKTIILWLSEEVEQSKWKKENFIQCFMICLRRLIYCVEYKTCAHYFIPDNNMFERRFPDREQTILLSTLTRIHDFGWQYLFYTETFSEFSHNLLCPLSSIYYHRTCLSASPLQYLCYISTLHHQVLNPEEVKKCITNAVYGCLYLPGSQAYIILLSILNQRAALDTDFRQNNLNGNKSVYRQHRLRMHYLIQVTNHDPVSGWLLLASHFYVIKQYTNCVFVIKKCLLKCTVEKISVPSFYDILSESIFQNHMNCSKKNGFLTACKQCTVWSPMFQKDSFLLPTELKPWLDDCLSTSIVFPTVAFAHYLHFLCLHHVNDLTGKQQAFIDLSASVFEFLEESSNIEGSQATNVKILYYKAINLISCKEV